MKTTKFIALLLVITMLATLCACSKKDKAEEPTPTPSASIPILDDDDLFPGVDTSPAPSAPPSEEPVITTPAPAASVNVEIYSHTQQFTAEDGNVVLELDIKLPSLWSDSVPCDDINYFYDTQMTKQRIAAEAELLPRALEAYKQSIATQNDFMPYYSMQDFEVTLNDKGYFSVVRMVTVYDGGFDRTLWAETYSLADGGRMTLDDVFSVPESTYLEALSWEFSDTIENAPDRYYPDTTTLMMRSFQKDDFYLTPDSIVLFFQQGVISGAMNGPERFTVRDLAIKEIFKLW